MANQVDIWPPDLIEKLRRATLLKDYAIENNLFVSDEIIEALNAAAYGAGERDNAEIAARLDRAIRDLTGVTFPATTQTIQDAAQRTEGTQVSLGVNWFTLIIAILLGAFVLLAILSFIALSNNDLGGPEELWASSLALSLGAMGALVFMVFNVMRIIADKAFNVHDKYTNYLRVLLGLALGWLFYFFFARSEFMDVRSDAIDGSEFSLLLLLPFLAGFSTRLVVGIFNNAIRAIELVLGIEDTDTQLLRRRRGSGSRPR